MPDGCLGTDTLCDFLEGRADPAARTRVEDHASRCAACRELLSSLARSGPAPAPPRPANVDPALAAGTVVGRYVIEREIGAGGMGVVYAARDPELGRLVAVKVLRRGTQPSTEERIRREAQAMARLAHPNVVAVHDVGRFEDRIFVAMEYVAGSTLARWSATPRSPREILDAYLAAGRGLSAAHAAGIVHRDFKPENVFVGHDGRVRVGDFGVARTTAAIGARYAAVPASGVAALPPSGAAALSSEPEAPGAPDKPPRLTAPGTLLGTPYYIAPELYDGADADARSDQFSFCVALFAALYGERPFEGDTFTTLASNVRAGRVRRSRAPGVPRRIHAAIRRGLSADPAARFPSLRALISELRLDPRRRLRRIAALGGGAALVVAIAALAWRGSRPAGTADEACGGDPGLAAAWTAERRPATAGAFTATGAPYAAIALRRVSDALDRHAARWVQADAEACRAARTAGRTGVELAASRVRCREPRRHDAAALIEALTRADRTAVSRAVAAVAALSDPAECTDSAVLQHLGAPPASSAQRSPVAPARAPAARPSPDPAHGPAAAHAPTTDPSPDPASDPAAAHAPSAGPSPGGASDPAAAHAPSAGPSPGGASDARVAQLDELARRLSRVRAALALGALAQARELAPPVVAAAHALGDWPLEAEAELVAGSIAHAIRDPAAEESLTRAVWSADAGRADVTMARARTRLVAVVGLDRAEPARALTLVPAATAAIARLGDCPALADAIAAELETALGAIDAAQGNLDGAVDHLDHAVALERRADDQGLAFAAALDRLAAAELARGHADRAVDLAEQALPLFERWLGGDHPDVAAARARLGEARAARAR